MRGTVKKAYELLESTPNAFMLQQFYNPATLRKPGPHHITGNGVEFKPDILDMDLMVEHRHWKSSEQFPR
ncbi:hypothetical protein KY284_011039 [Solanum tuberosum]|nr:hypothetical protein KY284_011039 [Solanum tuberosum]